MRCRYAGSKTGSYDTCAEALAALKDIQRRSTRDRKPQRAYPCQGCRKWHLTSQPKRNPTR